ncbi:MAG TPA: glycosyl transferase family 39, partial [Pseudomonadota bacterium]|nr:glycosyl transferase family 39 [Pseudomonadota bacterium]
LPFDGVRGHFSAESQKAVAGREVWVPTDVQASYEGYRFLLPAARIRTYPAVHDQNAEELSRRYAIFSVRVPLGAAACSGCRVLSERLDLRGRLSSADIQDILRGKVFETVFLKEMLVASRMPSERGTE